MKKHEVAEKMNFGNPKPIQGTPKHIKSRKSGKESLEIAKSKTGKNEGNTMMEGKNEQERQ